MLPIVKDGVLETERLRANVQIVNGEVIIKSLGVKKGKATLADLEGLVSKLKNEVAK